MPSLEFVRGWFLEAALEAKRQGRKDAAQLWKDGLAHLDATQAELATLRKQNERQSLKILRQAQRWINLKRFIIDQDKSQAGKAS